MLPEPDQTEPNPLSGTSREPSREETAPAPAGALAPAGAAAFFRALARAGGRALLVGAGCSLLAFLVCGLVPPAARPHAAARLRFTARPGEDVTAVRRDLVALATDAAFSTDGTTLPQADAPPGEQHVTLTLGGPSGDRAAALNAVAEAVVRESAARERRAREEELARAGAKERAARERLREARARLRDLPGGDADAARQKLAVERLAEADKELRLARSRKAAAEQELALARTRARESGTTGTDPGHDADVVLVTLAKERGRLLADIEHMSSLALPGRTPPALARAFDDLADVERRIRARREQLAGRRAAPALPDAGQIAVLEKQAATWAEREKRAEAEVRRFEGESRAPAASAKDVEAARDAVAAAEAEVTRANADTQTRAAELYLPPRVVVEEWAAPPPSSADRRAAAAALAGVAGVILVLLGCALRDYGARPVHAHADVTASPGLRVFGTLPEAAATVKRRLAGASPTPGDPRTRMLSEALDAVRTRLLHEADRHDLHVVLVTSAVGGEGKTSLASQLAISLARAWRRTLLIDADMRRPSAQRLFNLPPDPGLSEVLRGEVDLESVVHSTPISRLWALTAGQLNDHALQALAQDVGPLIAELKSRYDFVIIDSPPVLPVADALMLGQHVDGVLLSVLRGASRLPLLHEARQRLTDLGIPILGAVVAGVRGDLYRPYGGRETGAPKASASRRLRRVKTG